MFSRNFPDAVEVPEEIEMPPAAAVFSVGDGTEAEGLLFGYELGDFGVFDLAELPLGYPPLRKALPCLFEGIAPEEAADDIVTERGNRSLGCSEKGTSHLWSLHYRVTLFCVSEYSSHGLYHVAKRKQRFRPSPGFEPTIGIHPKFFRGDKP